MNPTLTTMPALCYGEVGRLLSSPVMPRIEECPKPNAIIGSTLETASLRHNAGTSGGPKRIEFTSTGT